MDYENTPEEILDLLSTYSFSELNEKQKSKVLKFLSEEEYDDYHTSIVEFKQLDEILEKEIQFSKGAFLFKRKSGTKKRTWSWYQVAASFLIFGLTAATVWELSSSKSIELPLAQTTQSSYVQQNLDPIILNNRLELIKETVDEGSRKKGKPIKEEIYPDQWNLELSWKRKGLQNF